MRKFQVTVNGNTYEVDVEEMVSDNRQVSVPTQVKTAPVAEKAAVVKSAPSTEGSTKVEAPMQGKIISVKVSEGELVKAGDVIAILEAMKMENEVVAPASGTVASVNVSAGQAVNSGDLIASLN